MVVLAPAPEQVKHVGRIIDGPSEDLIWSLFELVTPDVWKQVMLPFFGLSWKDGVGIWFRTSEEQFELRTIGANWKATDAGFGWLERSNFKYAELICAMLCECLGYMSLSLPTGRDFVLVERPLDHWKWCGEPGQEQPLPLASLFHTSNRSRARWVQSGRPDASIIINSSAEGLNGSWTLQRVKGARYSTHQLMRKDASWAPFFCDFGRWKESQWKSILSWLFWEFSEESFGRLIFTLTK